jgi:hypothetical protein
MPGKDYKSLRDVAKEIQSNLQKYAPERTGKLKAALANTNSVNKIIGNSKTKSTKKVYSKDFQFVVNYAPSAAPYGQWFNDPPGVVSKQRKSLKKTAESRGNWNFAQRSIDDAINKYMKSLLDDIQNDIVDFIDEAIDEEFKNL